MLQKQNFRHLGNLSVEKGGTSRVWVPPQLSSNIGVLKVTVVDLDVCISPMACKAWHTLFLALDQHFQDLHQFYSLGCPCVNHIETLLTL